MVDSHTIAVGTVTLLSVAAFIRAIAAVFNASSKLIQALIVFLKNLSVQISCIFFKKFLSGHFGHSSCGQFSNPY
jgi:hypothetical protein